MVGRKDTGLAAVLKVIIRCSSLLTVVFALQGCQLRTAPSYPMSRHTPTPEPVDLWSAYLGACEVVWGEADDAALVSASAQWQAVSASALQNGAARWSFLFYSETEGVSFDVVVDADSAQIVSQTDVWAAPTLLAEGEWREGPGDALLAFLYNGGESFLEERPQAVVDLHLGQDEEGSPTWSMVALDSSDRSVLALHMNIETGRVAPAAP